MAYEGDIKGLAATKPAQGKKIDPNSSKVQKYQEHLRAKHDSALAAASVDLSKKLYDYSIALDGAAVRLSGKQAEALQAANETMAVVELLSAPTRVTLFDGSSTGTKSSAPERMKVSGFSLAS